MTNPMTRIHNTETNEIIDREMTDDEFKIYQDSFLDPILSKEELEAQAAKSTAKAKLEALGLTLDDLKALGL
tara:strand:- start:69 stop:284 length:216 start_codon:yes stop_codon:yes gene_type:complete